MGGSTSSGTTSTTTSTSTSSSNSSSASTSQRFKLSRVTSQAVYFLRTTSTSPRTFKFQSTDNVGSLLMAASQLSLQSSLTHLHSTAVG
eukprot:939727-Rhodomonas_salina.2